MARIASPEMSELKSPVVKAGQDGAALEESAVAAARQLREFMNRYPRLLVLTGAGCSTESGIPGYRNASGEWQARQPVRFQQFVASEQMRRRYWARSMNGYPVMATARPNPVHRWLVELERQGRVTLLATQNVDGLHGRAGQANQVELHGCIEDVVCLDCGARVARALLQQRLESLNPAFVQSPSRLRPDGDADVPLERLEQFRLPLCGNCGGMLKPGVVMFGENVPPARVSRTRAALMKADALLVLGSSLSVYSAYRFCREAVRSGRPMAAVSLGWTRADAELELKLQVSCGALATAMTSLDD